MELNLFAMRTLLEVAGRGSFSKAAQMLNLTQPAVSLQIQNLENYFRTTLLLRGPSGKVELTEDGKIVYEYAAKLMDFQHDLMSRMQHCMGDALHRLKIAACVIAGEHLFPPVIKDFTEKNQDIRISLSIIKCKRIFEGILSSVFDVGITGTPPSNKRIVSEEIVRVPVAIFEAGNGNRGPREVSLRDLTGVPLIIREEGSGIWTEFLRFLKSNNIKINQFNVSSVSESNQAIKTMVKSGAGFSLFPRFVVEKELHRGELSEIHLKEGKMQQSFYLVYRKRKERCKPIDDLYDFMIDRMDSEHLQNRASIN
jgi:LysR family transcriptional regulator, transcriptional activator of the cysJI operon